MRRWFAAGASLAALGVALGAFGAHVLKTRLDAYHLSVFETGVRYQMYVALGLMAAAAAPGLDERRAARGCACLSLGAAIFSGSLYVLSLTGLRWLGALAPLGGLAMIAGWLILALAAFVEGAR